MLYSASTQSAHSSGRLEKTTAVDRSHPASFETDFSRENTTSSRNTPRPPETSQSGDKQHMNRPWCNCPSREDYTPHNKRGRRLPTETHLGLHQLSPVILRQYHQRRAPQALHKPTRDVSRAPIVPLPFLVQLVQLHTPTATGRNP